MHWMLIPNILTEEFMQLVADACSKARAAALDAGHPVVLRDADGSYVAEYPDGRRFQVRFDPNSPREVTGLSW